MAQKLLDFSTLRGSKGTAETGAFQGCSGGGKPQGARDVLIFGDGKRKRAMEHVAGTQRTDRMHREGRGLLQVLMFVEPDGALRTAGSRQERRRQFCDFLQCLAVVGDAG